MVADFRSEQVADIILECMADFIGIRRKRRFVAESTEKPPKLPWTACAAESKIFT